MQVESRPKFLQPERSSMNDKPYKRLGMLAASLLLATAGAQADTADARFGKAEMIKPAAVVTVARDNALRSRVARRAGGPDAFSPLAYDALAFSEEGLAGEARSGRNAVRLYPIGVGDATGEIAASGSAAPGRAGKDIVQSVPQAKKAVLPEPGRWAMILAGLLGVGAIARRRMSA
jgi:hypothetical protein